MDSIRRVPRTTLVAATSAYLFVSLSFGYWLTTSDSDKEYVGWVIVCAAGTLIAAALLLRFVPATEADPEPVNKPAKRGLILGVLSIVAIVVFWTGVPVVLGVPAIVLGAEGRARAAAQGRSGQATAAMVLGGLACVLVLIGSLLG